MKGNDATNLLFRLCLEGMDVGERWRELYNLGFVHRDEHVHVSTDVHLLVPTLLAAGDEGNAANISEGQDLICSQKFYSRNGSGDNVSATADVGVTVSEAMLAWVEADYVNAVAKMTPIRYDLHRLGFSRLHRDVFNVFLICVGLQSPRKEDTAAVRSLLEERKRQMGNTPFVEKYHLSIVSGAADAICRSAHDTQVVLFNKRRVAHLPLPLFQQRPHRCRIFLPWRLKPNANQEDVENIAMKSREAQTVQIISDGRHLSNGIDVVSFDPRQHRFADSDTHVSGGTHVVTTSVARVELLRTNEILTLADVGSVSFITSRQ